MGGLFKSKTKTHQTPFEQNPWEPQQPYLKEGFASASDALSSALGNVPTQVTADMNGWQWDALNQMFGGGLGQSQQASSAALGTGMDALGQMGQYTDNLGSLFDRAGSNRTGEILDNASQFGNDPHLQGQIDSALGDVRKAFDLDSAGINATSSGTGNINSTRAGALEARALDDAMDRAGNISSTMRGNAYQQGIDRSMLMDQANLNNQMNINQGYGNLGQFGLGAMGSGLGFGAQGAQDALGAGSFVQAHQQNVLDGQRGLNHEQLDLVNKYMQAIGGSYGSEGFNSQITKSASPFQQIMGGASTVAGMF